jgi:hypothetical protein
MAGLGVLLTPMTRVQYGARRGSDMSNPKPLTAWQQCKQITDAAMQPEDHEENVQRARAMLLAQVAAYGEKGAALAALLANADGPIQVADEDVPEELLRQMLSNSQPTE